jgi:hypothetical protein
MGTDENLQVGEKNLGEDHRELREGQGVTCRQGSKGRKMTTHSLPLLQKAQVFGNVVYSPTSFAKVLGISKQELIEKESRGIVPTAKRNDNHDRYYTVDDLIQYRKVWDPHPSNRSRNST